MKKVGIFLVGLLLLAASTSMHAQDYSFKWLNGNDAIGTIDINSATNEAGETIYVYASVITMNYAEEIKMYDDYAATYRNDSLVYLEAKRGFNGRTKIAIKEIVSPDKATREMRGVAKVLEREAMVMTYFQLFIQEPAEINAVYSELYGDLFSVVSKGDGVYAVKGQKNRVHEFHYDKKGKLIKAVINLNVGLYTVVPK